LNHHTTVFVQHKSELVAAGYNTAEPIMQTPARTATVAPSWEAGDLPAAIFDGCPDVSLLGGTCESPKVHHAQQEDLATVSESAAAATAGGSPAAAAQPLRIGYAESIALRFSSVPEGYDTATSTEKAVANAKQRLTDLTAHRVHQELGFCRIALRDMEPEAEQRTESISKAVAFSLQRQHDSADAATDASNSSSGGGSGGGVTVPLQNNLHIRRSFDSELTLNGVGGKGRVTGVMELYHVDVGPNYRRQSAGAAAAGGGGGGGRGKAKQKSCCGCGSNPAGPQEEDGEGGGSGGGGGSACVVS
jgi:hypothetical protein